MKNLKDLVRPNIFALAPYSCARNEFKGLNASAYLDANENPYNSAVNRYPDPLQLEVKALKVEGIGADLDSVDVIKSCFEFKFNGAVVTNVKVNFTT